MCNNVISVTEYMTDRKRVNTPCFQKTVHFCFYAFSLFYWLSTRSSTFSMLSSLRTERDLPRHGCRATIVGLPVFRILFSTILMLPSFQQLSGNSLSGLHAPHPFVTGHFQAALEDSSVWTIIRLTTDLVTCPWSFAYGRINTVVNNNNNN